MAPEPLGVVAAGHPRSAQAGADALREGGNAVDAALAAMLTAFSCEPLLTSLGAGGYMLVVEPGHQPVLLDFFVEASGSGVDAGARAELVPVSVSFGDAIQVFNIGPASVGTYGMAAGVYEASSRFGRIPLADLVAPAARLARDGVEMNDPQAYVIEILAGIVTSTPECAAMFAPDGRVVRPGDVVRQPDLADALERLGADGPAPFYTGDIAAAIIEWLAERGGIVSAADLAAYAVVDREPIRVAYRGREVVTNPPPSAGGILIAHALALLRLRATRARCGRGGEHDGADPGRADAGVPGGSGRPGIRPAIPGAAVPARVDHPRRRARPRGLGLLGHLIQRLVLGRGRARHRRSPEQHAGRTGP